MISAGAGTPVPFYDGMTELAGFSGKSVKEFSVKHNADADAGMYADKYHAAGGKRAGLLSYGAQICFIFQKDRNMETCFKGIGKRDIFIRRIRAEGDLISVYGSVDGDGDAGQYSPVVVSVQGILDSIAYSIQDSSGILSRRVFINLPVLAQKIRAHDRKSVPGQIDTQMKGMFSVKPI